MKEIQLREVVDVYDNLRKPLSTMTRLGIQGKYPYYSANGAIDSINKFIFSGEYILVAEDGSVRTDDGKPVVKLTKKDEQFWVSNHAHVLRAKEGILNKYLYYNLSQININQIITGAVQLKVSQENLLKLKVKMHSSSEQRHIVDTIGTIDDLIENREVLNKKLKQFSTDLYESYQLLDSSKTQLSIKECCKIKTGKLNADACEVNGRYPFFTCSREQSLINSYAFDTQAIIIAGNGDINCKFYKGKFNAYQRTYVLEPQSYFFLFLKQCEASINKLKKISQGSVIKFITKPMLEKIKIQLNDYALSANKNIEKVYLEMLNNSFEISKLKEIKALLLKKYF